MSAEIEKVKEAAVEIRIENVSKFFDEFCCLRDVYLDIIRGEIHTFLGPSGCGKTTLLRTIAGLEMPSRGVVYHNSEAVRCPSPKRGFVFQHGASFPWRTVAKNIEFGLEIKKVPEDERHAICKKYINLVGLNGFENFYPHQISGGMRQKMVLATVLATEPDVILMDEPFGALDAQTRAYMQKELLRIQEKTRKTIIFVTHSIREALLISNRVSVFRIKPGGILHTYDLDSMFGTPTARSLRDTAITDMEAELYKMLHSFSNYEDSVAPEN